jgi:gliding motility-associated-like protein
MHYYHTATDADGDSLTYEFCPAIDGASEANIKPIPVAPPYNEATYVAPYTSQYPVGGNPLVQIDPITGLITGTPDKAGRYLISVCCHEWRNGVMINTVRREYQIVVTDCTGGSYKPYAGRDTTVLMGQTVRLHGSNAVSFVWVPAAQLSDAAISEPYSYLPNPGLYTFVLQGTNDSGCVAKDSVVVWVLAHSQFILPNAFTPNGDGLNDFFKPNPIMEAVVANFKIYNRVGNLVYDGYGNDPGWDGTYKGIKQGPGVFFWQLSYFDNNGTLQLTKGDVTLIR